MATAADYQKPFKQPKLDELSYSGNWLVLQENGNPKDKYSYKDKSDQFGITATWLTGVIKNNKHYLLMGVTDPGDMFELKVMEYVDKKLTTMDEKLAEQRKIFDEHHLVAVEVQYWEPLKLLVDLLNSKQMFVEPDPTLMIYINGSVDGIKDSWLQYINEILELQAEDSDSTWADVPKSEHKDKLWAHNFCMSPFIDKKALKKSFQLEWTGNLPYWESIEFNSIEIKTNSGNYRGSGANAIKPEERIKAFKSVLTDPDFANYPEELRIAIGLGLCGESQSVVYNMSHFLNRDAQPSSTLTYTLAKADENKQPTEGSNLPSTNGNAASNSPVHDTLKQFLVDIGIDDPDLDTVSEAKIQSLTSLAETYSNLGNKALNNLTMACAEVDCNPDQLLTIGVSKLSLIRKKMTEYLKAK